MDDNVNKVTHWYISYRKKWFSCKCDDVKLIDELALKKGSKTYKKTFGRERPSLQLMKQLYDTAISDTPIIEKYKDDPIGLAKLGTEKIKALRYKANTSAVNTLRKM